MKQLQRFAAVIGMVALLGAGCGPDAAPGAEGTTPTPSRPTAGSCTNAYYPFKPNSSILYSMQGSGTTTDFRMSVLEPPAAGEHKMEYSFMVQGQESKITQEFTCQGGKISSKGYLDFASALGMGTRFESTSVVGEFLPEDLSVGKEWETKYDAVIRTDNPQLKALLDGKTQSMTIKSKVIADESVTVPTGTYASKKIAQTIVTQSSAIPGGATITIEQTIWLVKDIGLVRSEVRAQGVVSSIMEAKEIKR